MGEAAPMLVPGAITAKFADAVMNVPAEPALAPLGDRAETCLVEGANHSLAVNRRDPMEGADTWLKAAAKFIHRVSEPG